MSVKDQLQRLAQEHSAAKQAELDAKARAEEERVEREKKHVDEMARRGELLTLFVDDEFKEAVAYANEVGFVASFHSAPIGRRIDLSAEKGKLGSTFHATATEDLGIHFRTSIGRQDDGNATTVPNASLSRQLVAQLVEQFVVRALRTPS